MLSCIKGYRFSCCESIFVNILHLHKRVNPFLMINQLVAEINLFSLVDGPSP